LCTFHELPLGIIIDDDDDDEDDEDEDKHSRVIKGHN